MRKKIFLAVLAFAVIISGGCFSQNKNEENETPAQVTNVTQFIEELQKLPVEKRADFYNSNVEQIKEKSEFPEVTEDTALFYVENKSAQKIEIFGDINDWDRNGSAPVMTKIEGTDIFFYKAKLESNARVAYRYRVDGVTTSDILNKKSESGGFGGINSILEMKGYSYPETIYNENIPHGEMVVTYLDNDTIFGSPSDKRKIQIYLPPNYDKNRKHKVIYYQDGTDFVEKSRIPVILDNMINSGELEPVIAVFTDWLDRDGEYLYHRKEYLDFLLSEVVAMVDRDYSTIAEAKGRVIAGASNGGELSTYAGTEASDKFMYILNQSGVPAFGFVTPDYGMKYQTDNLPVKVFTVVGKYEKSYNRDGAERLHSYLHDNSSIIGEKLVYYNQGHSFRMWGDSMREALLWLFYDKGI